MTRTEAKIEALVFLDLDNTLIDRDDKNKGHFYWNGSDTFNDATVIKTYLGKIHALYPNKIKIFILTAACNFGSRHYEAATQLKDYLYVDPSINENKEIKNSVRCTSVHYDDTEDKLMFSVEQIKRGLDAGDECKDDLSGLIISRRPKSQIMAGIAAQKNVNHKLVFLVDDKAREHQKKAQELRDSGKQIPKFNYVDAFQLFELSGEEKTRTRNDQTKEIMDELLEQITQKLNPIIFHEYASNVMGAAITYNNNPRNHSRFIPKEHYARRSTELSSIFSDFKRPQPHDEDLTKNLTAFKKFIDISRYPYFPFSETTSLYKHMKKFSQETHKTGIEKAIKSFGKG